MLLTQKQRTLAHGGERDQRRNEGGGGGWRSKLKDWKHISGGHRDRETAVHTYATTTTTSSSSSFSDRRHVGRDPILEQQREKARVHVPSSPGYSSFRENLYDKLRDAYDRENATMSSSFSGSSNTSGRRTTAREVCVRRKPEEDIFSPENDPPSRRRGRSSKRNVAVGRAEQFSAKKFFRERGEREESNDENSAAYLRSFGDVAKKSGLSSASASDATVRSSSAEAYLGSRRNRNVAEEYATSEEKKDNTQRTRSAAPSLNRSKLSLLKHKLVRRGSSADGRRRRRRAGGRGSNDTTAKRKSKTSALVRTTSGVAKRLTTTQSIETHPKKPTSRSEKENDSPTISRRGHSATTSTSRRARRTPRPASRPPPPEYTPPPLEPTRTNVSHRPQKAVTGNVECTRRSGCPCDLCTGAVDPFTASEIASSSSAAKKPSTRTRFCSKCRKDISARIFSKHQRACNGQHGRQKGAAKKTGRRSNKKWALQSQQLREAMRAAREYKKEKAQGSVGSGSRRRTRQGKGRQRNKRVPETSRTRAPPPAAIVDPSLIPCPHCGRTFNETAHARHVKHCKHSRSRPKRLVKGGGLSAGSRKARLKSKRGSGIGGGRRNSLGGSNIGRQY